MPDRKRLVSTFWHTCLLALLAWLLVAPIRTSGSGTVSSRTDGLCRNFALPPGQPSCVLTAATAPDAVVRVTALPSEDEEQDGADALDEPRATFLLPGSFRKVPDRQLFAPRSTLSHYPLRC